MGGTAGRGAGEWAEKRVRGAGRAAVGCGQASLLRAAALLSLAQSSAAAPAIEPSVNPEASFRSSWHEAVDRTWISENTWANRLQDWRLEDGGLQCVESRPRFGMRTLHLLTRRLGGGEEGSFRMRVTVDASAGRSNGERRGLPPRSGGAHVDPRLTSQVHGAPAQDGGFLALLGADGRVTLRTFEEPVAGAGRNQWAMTAERDVADFARLEGVVEDGAGFGEGGPRPGGPRARRRALRRPSHADRHGA